MDLILSSFLSVDVFTCLMLQLLPAWTLHHDSMIQHATSQANTKTSLKHSEINTQQLSGCYHSHPFFLPPNSCFESKPPLVFSSPNNLREHLAEVYPTELPSQPGASVTRDAWISDGRFQLHLGFRTFGLGEIREAVLQGSFGDFGIRNPKHPSIGCGKEPPILKNMSQIGSFP